MELVLTWQQQRLMGRAFQLVAICVPRPEPTRRPRPMRALCPTNQKVTHSPQCVSPGKVDVPRWTGQRQGYDKSAFLIHKHFYTMISSDPHHNPGRHSDWHQQHITEEEMATQRNKGTCPKSSKSRWPSWDQDTSLLPTSPTFTHYICRDIVRKARCPPKLSNLHNERLWL